MINILKGNGCHHCDTLKGPFYNINLDNLAKPLKLCEKCTVELYECLADLVKTEGLLEKEGD